MIITYINVLFIASEEYVIQSNADGIAQQWEYHPILEDYWVYETNQNTDPGKYNFTGQNLINQWMELLILVLVQG